MPCLVKESDSSSRTMVDVLPGISRTTFLSSNQFGRVMAVVLVVAGHLPLALELPLLKTMSFAKVGVALFTFYSGLLLQYNDRRAEPRQLTTGRWLARRAVRIYPAYWMALVLCLIISAGRGVSLAWSSIAINFLGLQLFVNTPAVTGGFMDAYWYVSFILGCYVFFLLVRKIPHKGLIFLVLTGLIAWRYGTTYRSDRQFLAALATPMFLIGIWAGDCVSSNRGLRIPKLVFWLVAFFSLGLSGLGYKYLAHGPTPARSIGCLLGFIGLIIGSLGMVGVMAHIHEWLQHHASRLHSACLFVGGISYEIYLFHLPCFWILVALGKRYPVTGLIAYFATVMGVAFLCSLALTNLHGKVTIVLQNHGTPAQSRPKHGFAVRGASY